MLFTAPKRDTTSPRWRFSKYCAGSRSRWLKTLACHCTPSRVLMCIITQARTPLTACCISSNRPKPMARVLSRSRSSLTMTLSMVHCRKNGLISENTSSAPASSSTWASERYSPVTLPSMPSSLIRGGASCFSKPLSGQSSRATPVKLRETSSRPSRRWPWAGSWSTAPRPSTALSTTKWLKFQCSTQGSLSLPRSPRSSFTARVPRPRRWAVWISCLREMPLSDTEKRRRSSIRPVWWPW
ncbi:Uncharacterised protein [Pseudomonas aeruginosa]|nr:hypothetical protein LT19_03407 [Pseudomonas aeruginosa]RCL94895.1 hypothetical protein PA92_05187 [Pseudomonas aeruginosa]RCM06559.1 hypothetical protein PA64_05279 [Pseudomonas aeruginosa]CRR51155.1 hypothetical protein PAERUG_E16_London_17_VIM_2_04_14_05673 [Pseudomonas aeruginosa]SUC54538.1 Uncharacterised protein [Pseudomonas aeruginosa]